MDNLPEKPKRKRLPMDAESVIKRRRKLARNLAGGMSKTDAGKYAGYTGKSNPIIRAQVNKELASPEFQVLLNRALQKERLTWNRLAHVANQGLNRPWDEKGQWYDRAERLRKLADEVDSKSTEKKDPSLIIYAEMVSRGMIPEGEIIDVEEIERRTDQQSVLCQIERDRKRKAKSAEPDGSPGEAISGNPGSSSDPGNPGDKRIKAVAETAGPQENRQIDPAAGPPPEVP